MMMPTRWRQLLFVSLLIAIPATAVWLTQRTRPVRMAPSTDAALSATSPLTVLTHAPIGREVPINTDGITVMLNHAMVPLTTLDEGRDRKIDLQITPAVDGKFFWLGTHGFIFRPAAPFDPATTYRVTLPAGITAITGDRLADPMRWEFSTVAPRVVDWTPSDEHLLLPKEGVFSLRFNIAMDRASVEKGLTMHEVHSGDVLTTGRKFVWLDTDHLVVVKFTEPLPWDAKLTVTLAEGVRGKYGEVGTVSAETVTYATPTRRATIEQVVYDDAEREYVMTRDDEAMTRAGAGVCYVFNQAIVPATFEKAFRVDAGSEEKKTVPYFYYRQFTSFDTLDARGTLRARDGYVKGCASFLEEHDRAYRFSLDQKKIVTVSGAIFSARADTYRIRTDHAQPTLTSRLTKNVLSLTGPMRLPYRAINLNAIQLRFYRLSDPQQYEESVRNGRMGRLETHQDSYTKKWVPDEPLMAKVHSKFSVPVIGERGTIDPERMPPDATLDLPLSIPPDSRRAVPVDLAGLRDRKQLTSGRYLVEAIGRSGLEDAEAPAAVYSIIQITPVGLSVKLERDHVLVWATDIESGVPLADLPVRVSRTPWKESSYIAGTTNADGVAILPGTWNMGGELCAEVTDDTRSAYTCEGFHRISGYRTPLRAGPHYFAYVYTDRPIYRPGQQVHFSSFIREVQEGRYFATDADLTADIEVTDAAEEVIHSATDVKIGPGGVVHGRLDLPKDEATPRGNYRVAITVGGQTFRRKFQVASYRKPSFKVDLSATRAEILSGEPVDVGVTGAYFFGAPMRRAKAFWSIMTTTYHFAPEGFTDFSFLDDDLLTAHRDAEDDEGEYDYDSEYEYDTVAGSGETEDSNREEDPRGSSARRRPGQLFAAADGTSAANYGERLDEAGRLAITYRPDLKKYPTSQVLTVEARVEDPARQEVAGAEDLIVHKANFYLGIKPEQWVNGAGTPALLHLVSLDTQGQPLAARAFTAAVYRREYQYIERRNASGFWEYDFEHKDTKVDTLSGTTDAAGRARTSFTPSDGGTYRVVVKGKDDKGRAIQSATTLYAWGTGYVPWRLDRPETIELVPDKESYQVGDTAKILVKSLVPVTKALMTLERGRLLDYRIVALGGNAAHLELPITEGMIPNLFVGLVAHVGRAGEQPPMLFHGETELHIEPERKRLHVTLTPDRKAATSDQRPPPHDRRTRATSDVVPIYRPGEAVTVKIETRDGAGAPRKAHVIVSVADESVLRLLDYQLPDLVQWFYYWRANSVSTSSLLRSLKAGDGGVAAGKRRRIFKDTAHFEAHLETNAQGKGKFTFTLPDDLTTWVIEAVAIAESKLRTAFDAERAALGPQQPVGVRALDAELTLSDNTLVGGQRAKIMTTLPVLVRPALPRFAVWGDRVRARVVANNQNAVPVQGTLVVTVSGDAVLGNGTATQEIPLQVAAHAEQAIPVEFEIRSGSGGMTFAAEARGAGGKVMDAVEISLPVLDRYAPEVVATSGVTETSAQEQIYLPASVTPDKGGIDLRIKASLGLAVATPLKQLIDFPWGCSEQRSAALLGLLMARQMSASYGEPYFDALAPVAKKEIPEHATFAEKLKLLDTKIAQIIDDLVGKFQMPGGGIRYWPGDDEPSLYPSVQTLWAFTLARELHHEVSASAIVALTRYIQAELSRKDKAHEWRMETGRRVSLTRFIGYVLATIRHDGARRADELAYGLWGLSLNQAWVNTVAEDLLRQPARLSASGAAYLAMALANHHAAALARPIAARLEALAQHAPRHVSWPKSAFFWSSAVKNTAMAARALLQLDPGHPLPARALAFLLNRKATRTHVSTQDNLYVAAFAYEYGKVMKEDATDYVASIAWRGIPPAGKTCPEATATWQFSRRNLLEPQRWMSSMPCLGAPAAPIDLRIVKKGVGALYYDLVLTYYLSPAQTPTREEGLIIAREYYALDDVKEEHPLTHFAVGENYRGHITLVVPKELNYVLIQDLLPGGFEPIDMTLATSARAVQAMARMGKTTASDPHDDWRSGLYDDIITVEEYGADWGFAHQEIRDDAIIWSDTLVPPGVYHLRYPVRATTEGTFLAAGATAFAFYEPEIFGRSRTRVVEVRQATEKGP